MGCRATASAGVAVFHHKWPLSRALAEARAAEERAKETLGRNALAISILRRSGQITRTGLKFLIKEGGEWKSPIPALQSLCHAFAFDRLSPRFLSEIVRRLQPLDGGLPEGQLMELATPLVEQALGDHVADKKHTLALRDALRVLLVASQATATGKNETGTRPLPPDRAHLDRWLGLIDAAAFLGRGGDEE
jgi:hypothetical protein